MRVTETVKRKEGRLILLGMIQAMHEKGSMALGRSVSEESGGTSLG